MSTITRTPTSTTRTEPKKSRALRSPVSQDFSSAGDPLYSDPLTELSHLRWRPGQSSAIRCYAYRKATKTLYVAFQGPDSTERGYAYHGVSAYRAHQFRQAPSRGRYIATVIKPLCRCTPFEVFAREPQLWRPKAETPPIAASSAPAAAPAPLPERRVQSDRRARPPRRRQLRRRGDIIPARGVAARADITSAEVRQHQAVLASSGH